MSVLASGTAHLTPFRVQRSVISHSEFEFPRAVRTSIAIARSAECLTVRPRDMYHLHRSDPVRAGTARNMNTVSISTCAGTSNSIVSLSTSNVQHSTSEGPILIRITIIRPSTER